MVPAGEAAVRGRTHANVSAAHPLPPLHTQDYEVARRMEKEADTDNMVFLSDVHLDSASVRLQDAPLVTRRSWRVW